MLNRNELIQLGMIPKTNYKMNQAFPKDFVRPEFVSNEVFKKLPLYIQVGYMTECVNGRHNRKI